MMAFLYHKLTRKALLTLILVWGICSFWYLNSLLAAKILLSVIALAGQFFIWFELSPIFILILLSFTSAYALYGFFVQLNSPTWLVMLAILIIYSYLFTYVEQKTGILGDRRLIYLILFALIVLEVFLTLSYFPISSLSQSLIISTISYLFTGFCLAVLAQRDKTRFSTYFILAATIISLILLSSTWAF